MDQPISDTPLTVSYSMIDVKVALAEAVLRERAISDAYRALLAKQQTPPPPSPASPPSPATPDATEATA